MKKWEKCAGCGRRMDMYESKICPRDSVNPEGLYYHPECVPEELKK
jgi:hypothetical protein